MSGFPINLVATVARRWTSPVATVARRWTRVGFHALASVATIFLIAQLALAAEPEITEPEITDFDREHWAFTPLQQPAVPMVQAKHWPQTPVDHFVLHQLEQLQRSPLPPASRTALLRRVKFDLLGLPPTPEEIREFQQDRSPDAYRRLVDRLLASPAYGERWAQHWLDLARFAETDGFEHDRVRKQAWQYRQWVLEAFNQDMPYDRFVRLQLAGDLTGDQQDAIATMFCMAGPDMPDINEQDLRRHDKMNELTSTVGAALLGLQMHCAQCHDHKYDAISQADFYRLRGIFEAAVPVMRRDQPVLRLVAQAKPVKPRLYARGELHGAGPELLPAPPRIACDTDAQVAFDVEHPRPAFAKWLFGEQNPLTARVIANRIWQHHFGRSLSENPSDFGVIAAGPSHPQLLDWLATELRRGDWSLKRLHRVILLSAAYQQASYAEPRDDTAHRLYVTSVEADPGNRWLGRFPRKRLEGETIRDALLAVSGQLDRRSGGPSVMPPLPPELLKTLLKGHWKASENPADHVRRSIYVFARRNLRYPIFDAFDRPDAGASCAVRHRSTTAIQSLQMLNSRLAFDAAQALRDRLLQSSAAVGEPDAEAAKDDQAVVRQLFLTALGREPAEEELLPATAQLADASRERSENLLVLCVAVLNSSEFLYVD
ncbi:DUF1549 and DUF1553 domain-containing protein [Roseimaritima ulvae]|uniref:Planctomycete cytochrome C n=1 Tax=Roseimaritima ulvae TaxID=980254 RepID=A0A5B9R0W3_9BACT|nr:DUF1549 and DUF1553 domain-containing protein [Roseimaritima ulvae]QEG43405.1 hypothetical protein UC8_54540 [Roseimaritima ulvae]